MLGLALLLTLSRQPAQHDAIAIATGPHGYAAVWEEQTAVGGQRVVVASQGVHYMSTQAKVLDAGAEPSQLSVVWNGSAWTIAVCNPAWGTDNHDAMLVWGELSDQGTFTRQGEYSFGPGAGSLSCSQVQIESGVPTLFASVRDDDDHCVTRRFDLDGRAPRIGPPRGLCHVWASTGGVVFGDDAKGKGLMVDAHGNEVRTAVTVESDASGATVVTRTQATIRFWAAPFKKPARAITLPGKPIDPAGGAAVIAMPDGGVALVQAVYGKTPHYEAAWFDKTGKLVANDEFGERGGDLLACAAAEDALYCAWADPGVGQVRSYWIDKP
jgi:hypothetical protein